MKKVTESRTYDVNLTPEEARAIILLDSYVIRGPLRELAAALQKYEGEPNSGGLLFDVYDHSYEELHLGSEPCVTINFDDNWEDWGW